MATDGRAFVDRYLGRVVETLAGLSRDDVQRVWTVLEQARASDRTIYLAGNGGSAAIANHMANDLMLGVAKGGGRGFRAVALCDNVAVVTAIANDDGYAEVFARQLRSLARAGDVLILLSCSGESENVVQAARVARDLGVQVVGLLGGGGGRVLPLCDAALVVPHQDHGVIEDALMVFDHLTTGYFNERFSTGSS